MRGKGATTPAARRRTVPLDSPQLARLQLIDIQGLASLLAMSVKTVRRRVGSGDLPEPDIVIGARLQRWRVGRIKSFIEGQKVDE